MKNYHNTAVPHGLVLRAETAEELMTPNPVSISKNATVHEAAAFLTQREISAAPVIDAAGRPVGVLSRADIVRYEREKVDHAAPFSRVEMDEELTLSSEEMLIEGFQVAVAESVVADIMTPAIISVVPSTSVVEVVAKLLAMKLHRLFVVDEAGVLVGVISTFDVLRKLRDTGR
jgi:CBS domain-containing protein